MIHLVCLTKPYNENDFKLWYEWYKKLDIDKIHIFNNDSDLKIERFLRKQDSYHKIQGWPNQWQLFSDILNHNSFNMSKGDIIMFFDDDEFLWCDGKLEETIRQQFKMLDCVLVPQILIGPKELPLQRSKNVIESGYYRRTDLANQGKCILLYDKNNEYDFTKEVQNEKGHVPFINGMRYSDVVGSDCSKTTYGLVAYDAPLRLYHYHMKSIDDWKKKIERGTAACPTQFYDSDVTKDKWYGGYSTTDLTMLNTARKFGLL
jgi:hypothetical protein